MISSGKNKIGIKVSETKNYNLQQNRFQNSKIFFLDLDTTGRHELTSLASSNLL